MAIKNLLFSGKRKLNWTADQNGRFVDEEDGREITHDGELVSVPHKRTFLLLERDEIWLPRAWVMYGSRTIPDSFGTAIGKFQRNLLCVNWGPILDFKK